MQGAWTKYFDPQVLERLRGFRLQGKRAADGMMVGAHRSPRHGQAIEFSEHRQYVPGDDLRQLDWKVLGRTDKYYLRQREDETTLACHLLLDCSGSMRFQGDRSVQSKWEFALRVVAGLAFVAIENHDHIALTTLGERVQTRLSSGGGMGHLVALAEAMDRIELEGDSAVSERMMQGVQGLRRGGLVVVVSDLLDDTTALLKGIRAIRYSGRPVIVVHVIDPDEEEFPFAETIEFLGLEGEHEVTADTLGIAQEYRREFARHSRELQEGCRGCEADYWSLRTDASLAARLPECLSGLGAR
jgi:uncharacterized protein (DUF58 family)